MPRRKFSSEEFNPAISPEDVSGFTGVDLENLEDEEHPGDFSDIDMEGTGVDSPNLEIAKWDVEIEKEDRDNIHWKDIKFSELEQADEAFYAEMAALRRTLRENPEGDEIFWARVEAFLRDFEDMREAGQDNVSRINFYGMMGSKVAELDYALQKRIRARMKK
jgi:hypothetical protein